MFSWVRTCVVRDVDFLLGFFIPELFGIFFYFNECSAVTRIVFASRGEV